MGLTNIYIYIYIYTVFGVHQYRLMLFVGARLLLFVGFTNIYIHGIFGREITKCTVIYGVYKRFWPNLAVSCCLVTCATFMLIAG